MKVLPAAMVTSSGQMTVVVRPDTALSCSAICCSTTAVSSRVWLETAENRNATATPAIPSSTTTIAIATPAPRPRRPRRGAGSSPKIVGYAGAGADCGEAPGSGWVESDQDTPFHQRRLGDPDGSGYQPGSGERCSVTRTTLAPALDEERGQGRRGHAVASRCDDAACSQSRRVWKPDSYRQSWHTAMEALPRCTTSTLCGLAAGVPVLVVAPVHRGEHRSHDGFRAVRRHARRIGSDDVGLKRIRRDEIVAGRPVASRS